MKSLSFKHKSGEFNFWRQCDGRYNFHDIDIEDSYFQNRVLMALQGNHNTNEEEYEALKALEKALNEEGKELGLKVRLDSGLSECGNFRWTFYWDKA